MATFTQLTGNAVINGTPDADLITTGTGNDFINAGEGANTVLAGEGANVILAGSGNDTITSGSGNDVINAGNGSNTINAGGGANNIDTGTGNDDITTGSGNDVINAGAGNNRIQAGNGVNSINTGSGNDEITSGSGNDNINAGDGTNTISAGDGNNNINTGSGTDTITSGSGNDNINAGNGNNSVTSGAGLDVIVTGSGTDLIDAGAGNDVVNSGGGNDVIVHRLAENVGSFDQYEGNTGLDTLRLDLSAAEWARPDVQADVAAFLARANPSAFFRFNSTNLTVVNIERLEVFVGGVQLTNPANEAVSAVADSINLTEDTPAASVNLLANDSVPDRAASVTLLSSSTLGTVTLVPNLAGAVQTATLNFVPNASLQSLAQGQSVSETLQYRVQDVNGDFSIANVVITVTGTNDAPVASAASFSVAEDSSIINGSVSASDVDANAVLSFALDGVAPAGLTFNANGSYAFDPSDAAYQSLGVGQSTVLTIPYTVTDDQGATNGANLVITVIGTNDTPVAQAASQTVAEDAPVLTGTVVATDVDANATLSYALDNAAPAGLSFNPDGSYAFDPSDAAYQSLGVGQSTVLTIPYTATDDQGATSGANLVITITGTNDTPVAQAASQTVAEDDAVLTGNVVATDVDANAVLSYALDNPAPAGLSFNANGSYSFDPSNAAYQSLGVGQSTVLTIPYTVTDDQGATNGANLVITVTGTNDAPVAQAASQTVAEDAPVLTGTVVATDVDANATLSYALDNAAPAGLSFNPDGSYAFDPSDAAYQSLGVGQSTVLTIPYTATDDQGATSGANLVITITGTNDTPVAQAASQTVAEDDAVLTGNVVATDVDANAVLSYALDNPAPAGLSFNANGSYSFDPSDAAYQSLGVGQSTVLTIPYTATDDQGATNGANLVITITGTNDTPVAQAASQTVAEDDAVLTGNVVATDVDANAVLSYALDNPAPAGLTFNANGSYAFDPSDAAYQSLGVGQSTVLTIPYTVTDDQGATNGANLVITVIGTNDTPVAQAASQTVAEDAPVLTGTVVATDVDANATLSYALDNAAPAGLSFNPDGSYAFDPSDAAYQSLGVGQSTVLTIPYTATDDQGATSGANLVITITGTNDTPVAQAASQTVAEDDAVLTGNVVATDVDANAVLSYALDNPAPAGLSFNANGSYSFDPSNAAYQSLGVGQSTVLTIPYTVTDDQGATNGANLVITVTGTNDAPVAQAASQTVAEDAPVLTGTVVATDVDANATLSYALDNAAPAGLSFNPDGSYAFDPSDAAYQSLGVGQSTVLTIPYTATDDQGATSGANLVITITGTNDTPVAQAASQTVAEDDAVLTGNVVATDVDANAVLSYALDNAAPAGLSFNPDGSYAFDPSDPAYQSLGVGQSTVLTIPYTVTDDQGATNGANLVITVTGTNDAPVAQAASQTVAEDAPVLTGTVVATDVDANATLSYALDNAAPAGLSFNSDGSYSFDPSNAAYQSLGVGQSTVLTIPYTVTDDQGATNGANLVITITGTNDTPVAQAAVNAVDEDATITGNVSATDAEAGETATLTYTLVNAAPVGLSFNPDGSYSFDASSYDSLQLGETQVLTIPFTATDVNAATSSSADLVITITGTNDTPVAQAAVNAVTEDATITGSVSATDADAGETATLTYTLVNAAPAGLSFSTDGSYTFDASSYDSLKLGETLVLTIPFTATDVNAATSSSADLVITITGTNDTPVVQAAVNAVDEDATITGNVSATDADAGETATLTYALVNAAPAGLSFNPDGSYSFDASSYDSLKAGETLVLTIPFTATDVNAATSSSADLVITITGTNDIATVTGTVSGAVIEDLVQSTSGVVTVADADAGESLALEVSPVATTSGNGTYSVTPAGVWTYELNNAALAVNSLPQGGTLTDTFVVSSKDGSASQTVTVTIVGSNDAPVAQNVTVSVAEDASVSGNALATDVDTGAILGYALSSPATAPVGLTFNPNGSFSFDASSYDSLANGQELVLTVPYTVSDGLGGTSTADLVITITGTNDAPTLQAVAGISYTDTAADDSFSAASGTLVGADIDSGATLSYGIDGGTAGSYTVGADSFDVARTGSYGTLYVNASTGAYRFVPADSAIEALKTTTTETFALTVSDGIAVPTQQALVVTLDGANDTPEISVAGPIGLSTNEDTSVGGSLTVSDRDAGETITYSVSGLASNGTATANADGSFNYQPNANFFGTDSFTLQATDASGAADTVVVNVAVASVADTDTLTPDTGLSSTVLTPGGNLLVGTGITGQSGFHVATDAADAPGVEIGLKAIVRFGGTYSLDPADTTGRTYLVDSGRVDQGPAGFNQATPADDGWARWNYLVSLGADTDSNGGSLRDQVYTFAITKLDGGGSPTTPAITFTLTQYLAGAVLANAITQAQADAILDGKVFQDSVNLEFVPGILENFDPRETGSFRISVTATDSQGVQSLSNAIVVKIVNSAPVATDDSFVTNEDTAITFTAAQLLGNDSDANAQALRIVSVSNAANGSVVLNLDGTVTFTPAANYNGPATFDYVVGDGQVPELTDTGSVSITVNSVADTDTLTQNTGLSSTVLTPGGNLLVGTGITGQSGFHVATDAADAPGVEVGLKAIVRFGGTYSLDPADTTGRTYLVDSGRVDQGPAGFNQATPADDGWARWNYLVSLGADTDSNGGSLRDQVYTFAITKLDGSGSPTTPAITFTLTQYLAGAVLANAITQAQADAILDGTVFQDSVNLEFVPGILENFDPRETGSFRISVTATDSQGVQSLSNSIVVKIVNSAPVATDDSFTTNEDTAINFTASQLLGNDTDANAQALRIVSVGNAANGSVVLNLDGTVTFTPAANYNGPATFDYVVGDGQVPELTDTGSVSITVNSVADTDTLTQNTGLSSTVLTPGGNLLVGTGITGQSGFHVATDAADAPGVEIGLKAIVRFGGTYSLDPADTTGRTYLVDSGRVDQGPAGFNQATPADDGWARWNYLVSLGADTDSNGGSLRDQVYTFAITKLDGGGSPTTPAITFTLTQYLAGAVLANAITQAQADAILDGKVFQDSVNLEFVPGIQENFDPRETGSFRISVTATDSQGVQSLSNSIVVKIVNSAPVATDDSFTTNEDTAINFTASQLLGNDTDVNTQTLRIVSVGNAANGSVVLNLNGTVTFTPAANYNGPASFDYVVGDGQVPELTDTGSVAITVNPQPDNASFGGIVTGSVVEDTQTTFSGVLTVTDPDAGEAEAQPIAGKAGANGYGTFDVQADGTWAYTLNNSLPAVQALSAGQTVSDSTTVLSKDGTASQVLSVTISGTNDAPTLGSEQGFESGSAGVLTGGQFGALSLVSSAPGIPAPAEGGQFALMTEGGGSGPFTRFDGYRTTFSDGLTAEVKVYLDVNWALGSGFDYSVAANGTDGNHQRDFIFHVAKDTSTGQLIVAADNNTNFAVREDLETLANKIVVSTSGWYTLQHVFRDNGGVLAVDMNLLDANGNVLFTETRSAPADLIATEVGGNRYGWFTDITVPGGLGVDALTLGIDSGRVTERADGAVDEGTATLTATNLIPFTDIDLADVHSVSVAGNATPGYLGTLVAAVDDASTGDGRGVVRWTFSAPDSALESLGAGQTVNQTYTVTLDDGQGGSASKTVTITLTGSNDAAAITGTVSGTAQEDLTTTASGTLTVVDPDAGESLLVAVPAGTPGVNDYGTFEVSAAGNWVYTLGNALPKVQALAAGQTVTDSITVQSLDGTATQTITVTITGTNDVPVITGDSTGTVTEDLSLQATGTLSIVDADDLQSSFQAISAGTAGANNFGTFSVTTAGVWTYDLSNANPTVQALKGGETLTDSISVVSQDGTATQTVTVTIQGVSNINNVGAAAFVSAGTGFRIIGANSSDTAAFAVASAGDFNGDGFDDLVLTAPGGDGPAGPARSNAGEAIIVFGKAGGFGDVDVNAADFVTSGKGMRIFGAIAGDGADMAVAGGGDVNGDGFDDLIIGTRAADTGAATTTNEGEAVVVFGRGGPAADIDLATASLAVVGGGFRIIGDDAADAAGRSVALAGDINGDGLADMMIGADAGDGRPGFVRSNSGEVVVLFGSTVAPADVDLNTGSGNGFRIFGAGAGDNAGFSVSAAGDVNGDGYGDLLIGAPLGDGQTPARSNSGEAVVVFGKASGFVDIDLNTNLAALGMGITIYGADVSDNLGASVSSAGDINGDGFDDLVLGARLADGADGSKTSAGEAVVVFGKATGWANIDVAALAAADGFRIFGADAGDEAGSAVSSAGDVNGDGYDDLLIGSPNADGPSNAGNNEGEAVLVFGKAGGFGTIDLADNSLYTSGQAMRIVGATATDLAGDAVSAAGDINGDGFDDLVIGARQGDGLATARSNAGEAIVVFGGNLVAGDIVLGSNGDDTRIGTAAAERFVLGQGNDTVDEVGTGDVVQAGSGNDNAFLGAALDFLELDGGSGQDTLFLTGSGQSLDLTLAGLGGRVSGFETINIAGSGVNTLFLDAASVLDIEGSGNLDFTFATSVNNLVIEGDLGDQMTLSSGGAISGATWTQTDSGVGLNGIPGGGYDIYKLQLAGGGVAAVVGVNEDVLVTVIV